MDYHCDPDIDPQKALTPVVVSLFQRFGQTADVATLNRLLEEEFARHLKLCETAILYHASCSFYWCELPRHPVPDVNVWINRHLEELGFNIEHKEEAVEREVEDRNNQGRKVKAVTVRSYTVASWLALSDAARDSISAEWTRREALEEAALVAQSPRSVSEIVEGEVRSTRAIWAAVLDNCYIVEVQRLHGRNFLCLFDSAGRCLHHEEIHVAFGAIFGPDVGDVKDWQQRAKEIVASIGRDGPTPSSLAPQ